MPPKSRGQDVKGKGKAAALTSEPRRSGRKIVAGSSSAVPEVFKDMLAEAIPSRHVSEEERPPKRRRRGQITNKVSGASVSADNEPEDAQPDDDASVEFENVLPQKQEQTAYNESDEASSDDGLAWEEVGVSDYAIKADTVEDDGDLDLTLTADTPQWRKSAVRRRKAVNKAERALRLNIHKMHVLCILSYVDRRNNWCNDKEVQTALRALLTKQMVDCLKPKENYTQFGKAESVKKGLGLVVKMWESKYVVTAKGLHRSYWAENDQEIKEFRLHPDADTLHEKAEFRAAANTLRGSRDVGAQLFCALLRGVGLDVRLVCSLQPLPFSTTIKSFAPNMRQSPMHMQEFPSANSSGDEEPLSMQRDASPSTLNGSDSPGTFSNPRRRLGNPNAANYFMPQIPSQIRTPPKPKLKHIRESQFPIFWVEVLDEAHQKWMPVNPADPTSVSKSRFFEPPASDPDNNMSYVIAFEDDGAARDVTRRYTKAFNAKTRKSRVEFTPEGEKWWRKTMRYYSRGYKSDLDQIEDMELAAVEAREPMPKSIADFKDHSVYALERHLRRNEVLVNAREVGKVAAGRDPSGGKKLEGVFRRRDVKTVRSADSWYRIGREVKVGEQPVKVVASRRHDEVLDESEERAGTALYTIDQTELYEPPSVVNGRIPKNAYGNLDVYVSSMIPEGGVHIPHSHTSRAARLLGIDYADAVTGFEFKGRHGTAVIKGAIVAAEYKEAVEATIAAFHDEEAEIEEQMRSLAALEMWRKFMIGLRIKERVDAYEVDGEETGVERLQRADHFATEMDADEFGGGFLPADEDVTEKQERVNTRPNGNFISTGEHDSSEDAEDRDDDLGGGFMSVGDDSGMESEEYIDDGGGGFLSE